MRMSARAWGCLMLSAVLAGLQPGCSNLNKTQNGALVGTGAGAGLGAIIGHQFGSAGAGAAIGGLAGMAGGALAGNAADEHDRAERAERQASYQRAARYKAQRACTNRDVMDMARNAVSDRTIINTIRNRGGQFDTSPQAIIMLQQSGVSDVVIEAMQREEGG